MADIPARAELTVTNRPDPRRPQDPCRRAGAWRCARWTSSPRRASRLCASTIVRAPIPTPRRGSTSWPGCRRFGATGSGGAATSRRSCQREVRPEDNGQLGPTARAASSPSPTSAEVPRAKAGANTTRNRYRGKASSRPRWNMSPVHKEPSRSSRSSATFATADFGADNPEACIAKIREFVSELPVKVQSVLFQS